MENFDHYKVYEYKKEFDCSYRELADYGISGWLLVTTFELTSAMDPSRTRICYLFVREIQGKRKEEKLKEKQAALAKESNMLINRALADDYMSFMQRKYPVKINQRVYKRLIGE